MLAASRHRLKIKNLSVKINYLSFTRLFHDFLLLGFNFVEDVDNKSSKKSKDKKDPPVSPSSSILRKPVLQLSSSFGLFGSPQDQSNVIKSPFSLKLNSSSTSNLSSSIFTTSLVCHVCKSITTRKQPRKYGAVCCELCKKFMSRMIEKVNKNPGCSFQCDNGKGKNFLDGEI